MRKIPKFISDKVYQQQKYARKAQQCRVEIEEWFISQGMKYESDTDLPITDLLIDNEYRDNPEETVKFLEIALNEIE